MLALSLLLLLSVKCSLLNGRTWDEAIVLSKKFVDQLSLSEKCSLTSGVKGPCVGNIESIARLNFSGMCFEDAPSGVGDDTLWSTAFPPGIHIAATWDRDLFYRRASAIGQEFRGKGIHFALGPMMNIDRNARHGRNWEGFGSDPYLSGENAFFYIEGVQDQGVVATAKHFICNEQETHRQDGSLHRSYSSNLDDKTMHEIYLWPFASSVSAGVGSVMCSYNEVNHIPACQNNETLNGLLKDELEYLGNVMSDWGATKSSVESVVGGLDIDMPGIDGFFRQSEIQLVQQGQISETRINDMIIRLLTPYYLLEQDQQYPTIDIDRDTTSNHYQINLELSRAGMILLKNTNQILPLNISVDKSLFIYGDASSRAKYGFGVEGELEHGGALYEGGGSGFVQPTYAIDPLTALIIKSRESHLQIRYIADQSDFILIESSFRFRGFHQSKCLVFISAFSSEGFDRLDLFPASNGDLLVKTVASHCLNTIVIVNSVSQLNLEAWIQHPNVTGVIWSGMPGSEYGTALVDILFGDYNPGGKLVFSLAKKEQDYGTDISLTFNSDYTEGVFLDYRHFDKFQIEPRFSFGFGLSYTTFSFAQLLIKQINSTTNVYKQKRMRSYSNLGSSTLFEPIYEITFTLTNTGQRYGSQVPQLYLSFPSEAEQPSKILRGFERVYLQAGQSKSISLILIEKDISYWNVNQQKWMIANGNYTVFISTSANNQDIQLQQSFVISK